MLIILAIIAIEATIILYLWLSDRKPCGCNGLSYCLKHSKPFSDLDESLQKEGK